MTSLVFLGNLPSMYYSLKVTSIIIVFYIIPIIVIVTYPRPSLCHKDEEAHHSQFTMCL